MRLEQAQLSRIDQAVNAALETMCFTSVLDCCDPARCEESWITVQLHIKGEISGPFVMGVSHASAQSITANFLGSETDAVSEHEVQDVMCELANMVAGSLVSSWQCKEPFVLSHPEVAASEEMREHLRSGDAQAFALEDGNLSFWYRIEA